MTDAAGAQRVECGHDFDGLLRSLGNAHDHAEKQAAEIERLAARLRAVEEAGKVLVEANTRHFNAAREAEDKLRAVEAEKEVAVSEMIGLREVLRSVEGEHKAQLAALKVTFDSMHLACSNECARANAAEEEARRLREKATHLAEIGLLAIEQEQEKARRLLAQSEQAAIAWALEIEVLKEENGRLRAQIASVWLRMKNLTVELEDLLDSTKGAS